MRLTDIFSTILVKLLLANSIFSILSSKAFKRDCNSRSIEFKELLDGC